MGEINDETSVGSRIPASGPPGRRSGACGLPERDHPCGASRARDGRRRLVSVRRRRRSGFLRREQRLPRDAGARPRADGGGPFSRGPGKPRPRRPYRRARLAYGRPRRGGRARHLRQPPQQHTGGLRPPGRAETLDAGAGPPGRPHLARRPAGTRRACRLLPHLRGRLLRRRLDGALPRGRSRRSGRLRRPLRDRAALALAMRGPDAARRRPHRLFRRRSGMPGARTAASAPSPPSTRRSPGASGRRMSATWWTGCC